MKINVNQIPGYADMTPEQKIAALEGYDLDLGDGYVKKGLLDKAASDAAEWKRKYNATLTEQEQKAAKELEERQKLQEERDSLLKQVAITRYTSDLIGQGYPAELAAKTAEAMHSGDMDKVLANQKTFLAEMSKKAAADAMKGMKPPAGGGDGGEKESDAMTLARSIGKTASDSIKAANDVLSHYMVNK